MAEQTVTISVPDSSVPQPVPGAKSSEFKSLATFSVVLGAVSAAYPDKVPPEVAAAIIAALQAAYQLGRQALKAVHAYGYLKNIKDIPPVPGGAK